MKMAVNNHKSGAVLVVLGSLLCLNVCEELELLLQRKEVRLQGHLIVGTIHGMSLLCFRMQSGVSSSPARITYTFNGAMGSCKAVVGVATIEATTMGQWILVCAIGPGSVQIL
ncbi:hypothetical protein C5167_039489 [Papaver somniferum]|uniref:Uncharacterized protein n=1 Tax=Papaver somniferum TaxID=3469 RepID=A0A4Y7IGG8_PAPSO|nr:hypothetical protein C5167_039489 [Papaver somniferum]